MSRYNAVKTRKAAWSKAESKYSALLRENIALYDLIAQLAPEEPMNGDEQGGCVWCGHSEKQWFYETHQLGYASMYCDKRPETHKPDCPWLIAQQVLQGKV